MATQEFDGDTIGYFELLVAVHKVSKHDDGSMLVVFRDKDNKYVTINITNNAADELVDWFSAEPPKS